MEPVHLVGRHRRQFGPGRHQRRHLPLEPDTNQTITATPTATDADGDTVTFAYQWQKKVGAGSFTNIPGATTASLDLSIAGNGDKTDELRVR